MSLESFKNFVKQRPTLANFVKKKEMTWQDFYNLYELYGEKNSVWDKYLGITNNSPISFKDIFQNFKNIDMTEVQKGLNSLQKGISYLQTMVKDKSPELPKTTYEPRPIYKHFDD